MGNALGFLYANCCKPQTQDSGYNYGAPTYTDGVTALVRDIYQYETTSQVPEGLGRYVVSSKKAQANWYKKLVEAWKAARPTPRTPDEAARLVILTLKRHLKADVEGLLAYYGLPYPQAVAEAAELLPPSSTQPSIPPSKTQPAKGVKFELQTLPVDAKAVADGDTVTVYVNTADPREAGTVPKDLKLAMTQRAKARAVRDYVKADALQKKIVDAGYRVMTGPNNEDILAKKYRIRLSGIDAPESSMPFGKEAKDALTKLLEGKCLRVLVYGEDRYGRCVGDIYINNKFVQELMLKKGLVWHYTAYDKRPELASWEKAARAARVGLWASSNPEEPWEWRKKRRNK